MIRVMCGAEISKADSPLFSPIGYFHIFPDGQALYMDGFLYAGDFRERRAVVRLRDGLCTHIGEDGAYTHSCAIMIWMFIIKGLRVLGMSVDGHT